MKRLAHLAVAGLMLAASSGCCLFGHGGCGSCNTGCGYGGGGYGMYGPTGYAAPGGMTAGAPMLAPTTAFAPAGVPTATAFAPLNALPTYY